MTIHPVILAGGSGTRLWPISRAEAPKQFHALLSEGSMFQDTLHRLDTLSQAPRPPLVVCRDEHRFRAAEQLRQAGARNARIVLEPAGRNTAPAVCIAALHALEIDSEATLLVLPSDHAISDHTVFADAVSRARPAAAAGWLVTFGIRPTVPETGYGYIRRGGDLSDAPGCEHVDHFVEKPDRATAETYFADGGYLWNSGMFLVPARAVLDELTRFQPTIVEACRAALAGAAADLDFLRLDAEAYAACPAISLDHAVMEHTGRAAVVPTNPGWSDVGSWSALWAAADRDAAGNATAGDVVTRDVERSLLHSDDGRLIAATGLRDIVVVACDDAVLVCPRDGAQDVGALAAALAREGRPEARRHSRVERPWGWFRTVETGTYHKVKHITVDPGASLSRQRHRHRAEHWVVVSGEAEVTRGDTVFRLAPNESTYIPVGTVHRLRNSGTDRLHIVEIQSGSYVGEDDIERLEDVYGRGRDPQER